MKDITISARSIRRELLILLGAFIAANCMNIYAIIRYDRPATELFSMIGFVVFTAIVIYLLLLLVRLVIWLASLLFKRH